jgi:hypothetical protein
VADPLTFLNQERWKDVPPAAPSQTKGEVRVHESSPAEKQAAKLDALYLGFLKEGKPEAEAARLAQEKFDAS